MEDKPTTQAGDSLYVRNYLLKLLAHWYLFLISFILGFAYKYVQNRFLVYTYTTNATLILYDDLQNTQAALGSLEMFDKRKNYETEFGVLKSYSLNKIALSELDFDISYFKQQNFKSDIDLYKKTPFKIKLDSNKYQASNIKYYLKFIDNNTFLIKENEDDKGRKLSFGQTYSTNKQCFTVEKNPHIKLQADELKNQTFYFYKNDFNSLVLNYKNRLNVDLRSPNSSILWLWITGDVPERIVDYLNKLSEVYMRQSLNAKNRIAVNTIKFIDTQLNNLRDSLNSVENQLQGFEQSNSVLHISKQDEMFFSELERLQEIKKRSEISKNFYEYLNKNLNKENIGLNIASPYFIDIQDAMLEDMLTEYQKIQSEKEILQYDVKKDIPQMDILNLKLKQIRQQLQQHITESIRTISQSIKQNKEETKELYATFKKIPSIQRKISNVKRKYKLNDNMYNFLLEKRTEAGMTMASNSPGAKILDTAMYENVRRNNPVRNGTLKIILIALLLPVVFIEIKGFFNNKIIDRADVEKQTSIPILSSISHNTTKSDLPVHFFPKNPVSESFRLLKTNLRYLLKNKQGSVISVNSTVSGEGKTFCSTNLSILFAMLNKKVLLIGLDLRKPRIHLAFGISNDIGLSTYLINANSLDEVIVKCKIENLSLLPSGPVPPNPAELIESNRMSELMQKLQNDYDYIILDTAPIAHVADSLIISKFTDANIFVIRQNYSNKNVVKVIDELQKKQNIKNMGLVINDVNPSMVFGLKYGYGYNYGYSYGYGYGQEAAAGYYDTATKKQSFIKRISNNIFGKIRELF